MLYYENGGYRSRQVMAGHVRTHYIEAGDDGPPVVLLHGGGQAAFGASAYGKVLPLLGKECRAIALDSIGGVGDSDPRASVERGMLDVLRHLEDFADALCLERFSLISGSTGGFPAAKYAVLHPDRVSKLVFMPSRGVLTGLGFEDPHGSEPNVASQSVDRFDGSREAMRRHLEQSHYLAPERVTDELVDSAFARVSRPGVLDAWRAARAANERIEENPDMRRNLDLRDSLPYLNIPAIFLWGEKDNYDSIEVGKRFAALLPKVKFHWIPDASHQIMNDQPELASRIVLDFLRS